MNKIIFIFLLLTESVQATNLIFSTFFGASNNDYNACISLDSSGNTFVSGQTYSTNFPITSGVYDTSKNGFSSDIFVTKLNSSGTALIFSTFLGGNSYEEQPFLVVSDSENIFVTGYTYSTDFPTTIGAYDTSHNGNVEIFITKANSNGSALVYSTFLGGSSEDKGFFLSLDGSGNCYVIGFTGSNDFPTTVGAYDTLQNGSSDAFVTKLNSTGSSLVYSTFLGGSSTECGNSLSADESGNCYVTGYTYSSDFATTVGAFDTLFNSPVGFSDAFVSKLNSTGSALIYSTFLGGSSTEYGNSLSVDGNGNTYLSDFTQSTDFPTTGGAYDTSYNGVNCDVFVSKLNPTGSALVYSTFLGGISYDYNSTIKIDEDENVVLAGQTDSSDFPTTVTAYDTSHNGYFDAFVTKLNPTGSLLTYSTYFGGSSADYEPFLAIESYGDIFIAGCTYSSNLPTTNGVYDTSYNGGMDIFVTRFESGKITNLEIEVAGGFVILTWQGKLSATNYKIYRSLTPELTNPVLIGTTQNPNTFFTDTIAVGSGNYFYFVTWEN
ncbi:SBBP repeat-containing protein [bacterium]|nr:SBBP repeat-containing protein [bacterium]